MRQVGQKHLKPEDIRTAARAPGDLVLVVVRIHGRGQSSLSQVVLADGLLPLLLRHGQGRHENGHEHGNDGNNDQ